MPLVDTHVEVVLNSRNIQHFNLLGYALPFSKDKYNRSSIKRGTKLLVKTTDLTIQSHAKIKVECPICNKVRVIAYKNYIKSSDLCNSCSGKISGNACKGKNSAMYGKTGPLSTNWKGGRSSLQQLIRRSISNKDWIKAVFEKYAYTCQKCCKMGGNQNVHHIIHFNQLISLYCVTKDNWTELGGVLFDIDNGIVFCKECHKNFHKIYGKINSTEEQLSIFLEENK